MLQKLFGRVLAHFWTLKTNYKMDVLQMVVEDHTTNEIGCNSFQNPPIFLQLFFDSSFNKFETKVLDVIIVQQQSSYDFFYLNLKVYLHNMKSQEEHLKASQRRLQLFEVRETRPRNELRHNTTRQMVVEDQTKNEIGCNSLQNPRFFYSLCESLHVSLQNIGKQS